MSQSLPIVAIIGQPNVGKSSLFNRLFDQPRSVVAHESHTTRTSVEGLVKNRDRPYLLVDTAGIGRLMAETAAEKQLAEAVKTQVEMIKDNADFILVVVDGTKLITQTDQAIAKAALKTRKPVVLLVNKLDRVTAKLPPDAKKLGIKTIIGLSAVHNIGIADLKATLDQLLPKTKIEPNNDFSGLAFIGRPNVGKSALFNALSQNNSAIVSDVAGTTRDVKLADVTIGDRQFKLYDTGGVRRPGKRHGIEQFSYIRTLWAINQTDIAVLVITPDEITALDQKMAALVKDSGKGLIIAINKWDLVENAEARRTQIEQRLKSEFAFSWWAPIVFVSATTKLNLNRLIKLTEIIENNRRLEIRTPELNTWLKLVTADHPPSGLKSRQPKLKYGTQTGSRPPTFTFFGRDTAYLHWSYKRYLENQLRTRYDLVGTPIALNFKSDAKL